MHTISLRNMWSSVAVAMVAAMLLAVPAMADIIDGDFENGGVDWNGNADPGLGVSFPPGGGNPGGYARLESAFQNNGGQACILQTFMCGDPTVGTECTIGFDYKLTPIDADPGTARIIVAIDGVTDVVVDMETPGWEFVSYVVPCGLHVIEICLQVDPENNSWVACIDNVRAECTGEVPETPSSWSRVKGLYR